MCSLWCCPYIGLLLHLKNGHLTRCKKVASLGFEPMILWYGLRVKGKMYYETGPNFKVLLNTFPQVGFWKTFSMLFWGPHIDRFGKVHNALRLGGSSMVIREFFEPATTWTNNWDRFAGAEISLISMENPPRPNAKKHCGPCQNTEYAVYQKKVGTCKCILRSKIFSRPKMKRNQTRYIWIRFIRHASIVWDETIKSIDAFETKLKRIINAFSFRLEMKTKR